MTKKSSENEKTPVKIKASKGAWWNSKVEPEEKQDITATPPPKKSRTPRKKAAPKTKVAQKQSTDEVTTTKDSVVEAKSSVSDSEKKPQGRKPRKRTPRKTTAKGTPPVSTDKKSPVPVDAEKGEKASDSKEIIVQPEAAEEKTVSKDAHKPKRTPRKRARKPKSQVKEEVVETIAETSAVEADQAVLSEGVEKGAEASGEAGDSEPVKRNRRGRRRGRKTQKNKAQVNVQDETAKGADADAGDTVAVVGDDQQQDSDSEDEKPKAIRLLINAEEPEECRLALLEDGRLESIHVSTVNRTQTKSNIYKAKIVAIEPNLQAAFVDYGTPKNGFLPFSEIHPEYYKTDLSDDVKQMVEDGQWKRLKIEDVVERGQEMLVQVVKEEVGKKGANMTTYLSLPGRCVVLMPGSDSAGISRKISGESRRSQLRDVMYSLDIPEGIGWIVRTASVDITETALSRDVGYLLKLWEDLRSRGQEIEDVGLVYEDHRSVMRFLREYFDPSIQEILVDDQAALEQVNEFIEMLPSQQQDVKVRLHRGSRPIFNQFSVEDQIESIYQPQVNLPSGGSIVIDPTEALVAIDVNSGSTSKGQNFEESIFQANMEAAAELARQLRLRDLGGLIVVDFIDMRNKRHIRDVEKQVKIAMKRDKAKVDFSRISKFGLMQISRQKLGSPIEAGNYRVCQHCKGRGTVRSVETLALFYLRRIQTGASRNPVVKIECRFPLDVASYLLNNKRHELHDLENKYNVEILIIADSNLKPADNDIVFHKQEKEQDDKK